MDIFLAILYDNYTTLIATLIIITILWSCKIIPELVYITMNNLKNDSLKVQIVSMILVIIGIAYLPSQKLLGKILLENTDGMYIKYIINANKKPWER